MEPICKKCLLQGLSAVEFEKTIQDYLESLLPEHRVDDHTLHYRLSLCAGCESLANGICKICGCFVQARAAKRSSRCPAVMPKW